MKESLLNISEKKRKSGSVFFQPKLNINQRGDAHEQEAELVAEQIMRMPAGKHDSAFFKPNLINSIQRKCTECEKDELQRKEFEVSNELINYVGSLNSTGDTLPNNARSFFEPRFGYDFSNVKIHSDNTAVKSAESINAQAYTSGNNIVFNQNQYSPETVSGKKLLAHELTHVIQQSNTGANPVQKKDKFDTPPRIEDTPCERASFRREAKIPCPGEKGSELIIRPCIWTMFKNYGPCGVNIYPILKDTPTLKAYGELTEIESGEVKNVAAPKECIRFEVSCETNCDKTEDTRIRWGPPCVV